MLLGEKTINLAMVVVSFCCLAKKMVCSRLHATWKQKHLATATVASHKKKTINLVGACSNGYGNGGLLP